ncbi:hypothetical protein U1Q18_049894, partial [Sarracenia purpurea var. burkii]
MLFATGYFTLSEQEHHCIEFPNEEVKRSITAILLNHYQGSFINYLGLANEFQEFLFDDNLRSPKLEQVFSNFVLENQFQLQAHVSPSQRRYLVATTAITGSKSQLTLEVNEAFFASILRAVALHFRCDNYVAFEKKTDQGYIDIFVHDGKQQAIVELKYKGGSHTLKNAIKQAKKYYTSFSYPYKFIGILGHLN